MEYDKLTPLSLVAKAIYAIHSISLECAALILLLIIAALITGILALSLYRGRGLMGVD